jgi:magnesium chelatase family protein
MNPGHSGYYGSKVKQCRCSPPQREAYVGKISGPLLDCIAIHVSVQPADLELWSSSSPRITSIVRVARTIADLEGSENINERHIGEAVGYRGRHP